MQIKIKKDASKLYWKQLNKTYRGAAVPPREAIEYGRMLEKVNGMTLEVETKYLFKDQFNTAPIPGVTELGLRVMEEYVEEVIDDERKKHARTNNETNNGTNKQ
jgi:hypothetical protein